MKNGQDKTIALPKGIVAADLEHRGPKNWKAYSKWLKGDGALVDPRTLTLYETERFGWVITTLFISGGRSRGMSDRTYGISLEGNLVTVGRGPHVKRQVTVYLRQSRMKALAQYLELYNKGLERAHVTRDTISTRRANSVTRRSNWLFPRF